MSAAYVIVRTNSVLSLTPCMTRNSPTKGRVLNGNFGYSYSTSASIEEQADTCNLAVGFWELNPLCMF